MIGEPPRTKVEAPTKLAAEEEATRLGFSDPWAQPVADYELGRGNGFQNTDRVIGRTRAQTIPLSPRLTLQPPSTDQICTAIEVLEKLGERLHEHATHCMRQLPETQLGGHCTGRIEVRAIEQITRIQTVSEHLEQWRNQLLQQSRQCDFQHE